jgi:hypothetical protein
VRGSELKALGLTAIRELLEPTEWRYSGKTAFRLDTAPDIQAGLDYNFVLSNNPASARVTPYVQIIHAEVEKARKLITGASYYTANNQLRILMGAAYDSTMRWVFTERRGIAPIAELLVTDALTYAPAYYEPVKTLADVVDLLERDGVSQQSIPGESLAIAYCLLGEKDKAMSAIREDIDRVRTRPDEAVRRARLLKYQEIFGLPIGL